MEGARQFSAPERKKLAGGAALRDGSFPIKTVGDLRNAIAAYGRAKNKAAAKAHIIRRARALKATALLPKGWLGGRDKAEITCPGDDCARSFLTEDLLDDHAAAVHSDTDPAENSA